MKSLLLVFLAALTFLTPVSATEAPAPNNSPPTAKARTEHLPGVDLAQGITEITGTAISPLLGVCSVGAWRYFKTPAEQRSQLPWHCHPGFWSAGFALLLICLFKDSIGAAGPAILKKPLDMAELFENKASALVASAAFVPLVASEMAKHYEAAHGAAEVPLAWASSLPLAAFPFDYRLLFIPMALIAFLVVWLTGHAINVLIAICPFTSIDTLLKLFKGFLLSTVAGAYLLNPVIGATISVLMILIAAWMMPAAFRLTIFGTLFALDTVLPWRGKRLAKPDRAYAFLSRPIAKVPTRTYGRLWKDADGGIHFQYRPWLILPERKVPFPAGPLAVAQGVYFPSLLQAQGPEETTYRRLVVFLPRYRGCAREIATHLNIDDLRDSPVANGFKAAKAWLKEMLGSRKPRLEEPAAERAVEAA